MQSAVCKCHTLHSMPVKMAAAAASKAIWKLSLLTAEIWQETSLDIQKARRRGSTWCKTAQNVPSHRPPLLVLCCSRCNNTCSSPDIERGDLEQAWKKAPLFLAIIFSYFCVFLTEQWNHDVTASSKTGILPNCLKYVIYTHKTCPLYFAESGKSKSKCMRAIITRWETAKTFRHSRVHDK